MKKYPKRIYVEMKGEPGDHYLVADVDPDIGSDCQKQKRKGVYILAGFVSVTTPPPIVKPLKSKTARA